MPLDARAAALLAELPDAWRDVGEIESMTAERARALGGESTADATVDPPPGVAAEKLEAVGASGPLPVCLYRPRREEPVGTLLWIRGGGFVLGSLAGDCLAGPLAAASGCAVVSVEYRLAPEHPFPAGLEDCYAVACWIGEQAAQLGMPAGPIAIGGESAGGNLAAAAALLTRDRGGPELALQLLLYPMLARTFAGASRHDPAVGALARPEAIEWLWRQYLPVGDGSDPYVSPLLAATLAGLPSTLMITAEYDVLRDEGEAYADRLEQAGVEIERCRYDGMPHGFADWHGELDAADGCIELMGDALRRSFASA